MLIKLDLADYELKKKDMPVYKASFSNFQPIQQTAQRCNAEGIADPHRVGECLYP